MFGNAVWTGAAPVSGESGATSVPAFSMLRRVFSASSVKKATLRVLGLGFFHCYINGREVTSSCFLPLSSDYEPRNDYPTGEILTGHRIYVPEFDVTALVREGQNALVIHYGGGWYTFSGEDGRYGDPKAIYLITLEQTDGKHVFCSTTDDRIGPSHITDYYFTKHERQDLRLEDERILYPDYDDSGWQTAVPAKPLKTEYMLSDCPTDRVIRPITPKKTANVNVTTDGDTVRMIPCSTGNAAVYDCGVNLTGRPLLKITAPAGEKITVIFSEEPAPDGAMDTRFSFGQRFTVISDGNPRTVHPLFTWFGFRCFCVIGGAEPVNVQEIHTDISVSSAFDCDEPVLNWLYRTYIHTELCNMHAGIISDCPHIERRGYTGDGQLTCRAVMAMTDAKRLYRKWITDISDCQDTLTGHVQYTAPYLRSGGGPGGWGCAIIEVPYMYYRRYGETEPLKTLYPQMLRYFDYLEAHSENGLVTSDKAGQWCLGDWCTPIQVVLPAAFVNTYFYIKCLNRMTEIASVIGKDEDIGGFRARAEEKKKAVTAAYFNTWDSNFIGGLQGANAFALDIGLGNQDTYDNMVKYYTKLGCLDTGIFGTELVPKVLFERGDSELAVRLLTSSDPHSFGGMMKHGATTLWEYWPDATHERSHNHPMFGAPTAFLFDYILGIREPDPRRPELIIAPADVPQISRASGKREIPQGTVEIAYEKDASGGRKFIITVPENIPARLRFRDTEYTLAPGENRIHADT